MESYVRKGFYALDPRERAGRDLMWYIWLGEGSPLFGKDKMATFERYFWRKGNAQGKKIHIIPCWKMKRW